MNLFHAYDIREVDLAIEAQLEAALQASDKIAEFMDELDHRRVGTPRKPGRPPSGKVRVTLLLKPATIARFKATGKGWQARMSEVLDAAAPGLPV